MSETSRVLPFDERWFSTALRSIGDAVIATDDSARVPFAEPGRRVVDRMDRPRGARRGRWSRSSGRSGRRPESRWRTRSSRCSRPAARSRSRSTRCWSPATAGNIRSTRRPRRSSTTGAGSRASSCLPRHHRSEAGRADQRAAGGDRRVVRRHHRLQDARRHPHELEPGAEHILGYSAAEVVGQHVSMLMPPEAIEDTEAILGRVRRGEKVDHYQTRRRRKDGTIIDVSLTVSPIRDADRSDRRRLEDRPGHHPGEADRGRAAGGRAPQGRVPGDARPRAPQPALGDPQRGPALRPGSSRKRSWNGPRG